MSILSRLNEWFLRKAEEDRIEFEKTHFKNREGRWERKYDITDSGSVIVNPVWIQMQVRKQVEILEEYDEFNNL